MLVRYYNKVSYGNCLSPSHSTLKNSAPVTAELQKPWRLSHRQRVASQLHGRLQAEPDQRKGKEAELPCLWSSRNSCEFTGFKVLKTPTREQCCGCLTPRVSFVYWHFG